MIGLLVTIIGGGAAAADPSCDEGKREAAAEVGSVSLVTESPAAADTGIKLRYSAHFTCAWGLIDGARGADIWLDRSNDGGATIADSKLGDRAVQGKNSTTYTAAYRLNPTQVIRACGQQSSDPSAPIACTDWLDQTKAAAAPIAADQPRCEDGNRDSATAIANINEFTEADTKISFGSLGVANITLRYSARLHCAWGLLSGRGEIYVLRTPNGSPEQWVETQRITDNDPDIIHSTHTGAYDLTLGAIRVCGRTLDGSTSQGQSSSSGADVGTNGASISASDSKSSSTIEQLAGIQCTRAVP